jgi:hypothetical protein
LGNLLGEATEDVVVKRPRGECELLGLLNEGPNDAGVAMTLIIDIISIRISSKSK